MRESRQTRLRIETAALRLFVEKGVGETSIQEIAAAAGVAQGALYRHYPGKDAMVRALFAAHYAAFAARLERLQAEAPDARGKLARMIRGLCAFFDDDAMVFRFLLFAQHGCLAHLPADAPNPIDVVRRVVAAAARHGEIRAIDPDLATAQVLGVVLQTATFAVYGRIKGPLSRLADDLAESAWRLLAPDRDT